MLRRLICYLIGHRKASSSQQGLNVMVVCPRCKRCASMPALLFYQAVQEKLVESLIDEYRIS